MTLVDINIKVPTEMAMYLKTQNQHAEILRNALLLYPYIYDRTISHGKAAEILEISKMELIELYGSVGLAYISQDIKEIEEEMETWEALKKIDK